MLPILQLKLVVQYRLYVKLLVVKKVACRRYWIYFLLHDTVLLQWRVLIHTQLLSTYCRGPWLHFFCCIYFLW